MVNGADTHLPVTQGVAGSSPVWTWVILIEWGDNICSNIISVQKTSHAKHIHVICGNQTQQIGEYFSGDWTGDGQCHDPGLSQ